MPPLKDENYCSYNLEDRDSNESIVQQMSGNNFHSVPGFVQRNYLFNAFNNDDDDNNLMPALVQRSSHKNGVNSGVESGYDDTESNNNYAIPALVMCVESSDKESSNEDSWGSHLEPEHNSNNSDILFGYIVQSYDYNNDDDGTVESNLKKIQR